MPPALTLPEAAGAAFDNLQLKWVSDNLKSSMTIFSNGISNVGSEQQVDSHPIRNWFALIANLANQMPSFAVAIGDLTLSAEYIYRLCWVTQQLLDQSLISSGQAAAILLEYNVAFTI